jgi:hypothetical protein
MSHDVPSLEIDDLRDVLIRSGNSYVGDTRDRTSTSASRRIVLKNSKIAAIQKSRKCSALAISAAARLCRIDPRASDRSTALARSQKDQGVSSKYSRDIKSSLIACLHRAMRGTYPCMAWTTLHLPTQSTFLTLNHDAGSTFSRSPKPQCRGPLDLHGCDGDLDYRRFCCGSGQYRRQETDSQFARAHWRPFVH